MIVDVAAVNIRFPYNAKTFLTVCGTLPSEEEL